MRPLEIINAVRNYQNNLNQQQYLNQAAQSQNGWGGLAGALGQAFAGYQAGKAGFRANEQEAEIRRLEQEQAQEQQRIEQEQAKQAMIDKRAREDYIRSEKHRLAMEKLSTEQGFKADQNKITQQGIQNRFDTTHNLNKQELEALEAYRASQLEASKNKNNFLSEEDKARVANGLPTKAKEEYDRQKQLNKPLTAGEQKAENKRLQTISSLKNLKGLIEKHGTEWGGKKAAQLGTAFNTAKLNLKDAFGLGVLSGGDEIILENVVGDPTSFTTQFNPFSGGNKLAQLEEIITQLQTEDERSSNDISEQATTLNYSDPQVKQKTDVLLNQYLR